MAGGRGTPAQPQATRQDSARQPDPLALLCAEPDPPGLSAPDGGPGAVDLEPVDPQAGDPTSNPTSNSHDATLYFRPRAPRDSSEFYADARYGEMWVGRRPSLDEMGALTGLRTAPTGTPRC